MERGRALVDWWFRDRRTGRITIAQFPNPPLWVFLIAASLRAVLDPTGGFRSVLGFLATAGLVWWAVDELLRGVNPWRRLLGGVVLAAQTVRLVG